MTAASPPARVALMIPSTNTTMEPDFARALGDGATVHAARMFLAEPVTVEGELELLDEHVGPAARDLAGIDARVAVFGCTSAGALRGTAADERLRAELEDTIGAPVIGVLTSAIDALRQHGRRISVLTPYVEELNAAIAQALAGDFDVLQIRGMGIANNRDVGRCPPDAVIAEAERAVAAGSEALFVACTNLRALEAQPEIESRLGIPTVTANLAVIEAVRRHLDEPPRL